MSWNRYGEEQPPLNQLVIFLREGKEKYSIGSLQESYEEEEDGRVVGLYWVTQFSSMYSPSGNDHWLTFPYLKITQTKEFK